MKGHTFINIGIALLVTILFSACIQSNVSVNNDLKQYFDSNGVKGCFGMFDNAHGEFTVYNLLRFRDSSYLPASTFKIVNSLIGLQTGIISSEKMVIPWDGVVRRPEWDKDLTMEEAFKVSAVPYYQEVARRIGKDTMQQWLDSLHYGTEKITSAIDTFWLDNSLKVKPDEQLGLAKKLYFGQLPFDKRPQSIVKKIMLQESNANYQLSYKTGWGYTENGNSLGWMVGWIEENVHVYFFVLNIEGPHNMDMVAVRMNILKGILKHQGFMQGKK
ncbi:class D beta-lactamase [Ilyomonas limi]|uniref:Beta-lactamase n=1 Tax=Ilyomonas limi TaxID=2575867 RepID=A0A4U3LC99_9BACT|nr:class D beta-lactamase [Ilyomonas limi]TKK71696.1 class D beta-lactamase [Ilyomonas limi]